MNTKNWKVEIDLGEQEGLTQAQARLVIGDTTKTLIGTGTARLSPSDADVPEIGDELATARALSDLAHRLLDTAAGEIEAITHEPVHLYT